MRFGAASLIIWVIVASSMMGIFLVLAYRSRKKALSLFAQTSLVKKLTKTVSTARQKLKLWLIFCGFVFIVFSLLRPQWGFHWEEVKRQGLDIIIAIDTSKSMLAQDVKPNRLERSKLAVKDLLKKLKGDRIGLIAFAGSAFLQCPLTVDYNGFVLSLNDLDVNTIPQGGTSLARAIKEAIRSFEGGIKKYQVLVFITDGESHEGDTLAMAEEAKKRGIKIFCIGIGTKQGELIPLVSEEGGMRFLKDEQGNVVKSRLDEETLQKIALMTGGSYVRATGAQFGLDLIYEEKLSKMEKRELESKMSKQYEERYQWFLLIGILFILIEPFINESKEKEEHAV